MQAIELAAIRHYTSRGGDPHRHLHLQVNARVPAAGKWRGIDSAQLLRMQRAINGIGHRAVARGPGVPGRAGRPRVHREPGRGDRAVRVGGAGDVETVRAGGREHRPVRTAMAHRTPRRRNPALGCCGRGTNGPGRTTGRRRRTTPPAARTARPGGSPNSATSGVDVDAHLTAVPVPVGGVRAGVVDRDEAADRVVKVLSAGGRGRSTWNSYDIRGVAEEVLSARNVIAEPGVFTELAEDVTARAHAQCLSVLDRPVPDHIRHLTSQQVIDLEHDIMGRLAVRAGIDHQFAAVQDVAAALVRLPHPDGTRAGAGRGAGRRGAGDHRHRPAGPRRGRRRGREDHRAGHRERHHHPPRALDAGGGAVEEGGHRRRRGNRVRRRDHRPRAGLPARVPVGHRRGLDPAPTRGHRPGHRARPHRAAAHRAADGGGCAGGRRGRHAGPGNRPRAAAHRRPGRRPGGVRRGPPATPRGRPRRGTGHGRRLGAHPHRARRGAPVPHPRRHRRHRVRGPHHCGSAPAPTPRRCSTTCTPAGTSRSGTARRTRSATSPGTPRTGTWTGRRRRWRWPPTTTPPRSTRSSGNNSSPPAPSTTPPSPTAPTGSASAPATTS